LRRSAGRAEPGLQVGGVEIDLARRGVLRDGAPVTLSAREFAIVEALALRPGAILSRAQLEERMYGWGEEIESNAVEVHIHAIRRKLGADFIRNVRGVGYYIPRPEAAA
jgi:DNA-binding response OmpR family regulator